MSCTGPAQLTCLSADLCVATLVDTATGNSKRSSAVHAVLQQISGALHEQAGAAEASSYAQLLECVQHGTAYLASTFGCGSGPVAVSLLAVAHDELPGKCCHKIAQLPSRIRSACR